MRGEIKVDWRGREWENTWIRLTFLADVGCHCHCVYFILYEWRMTFTCLTASKGLQTHELNNKKIGIWFRFAVSIITWFVLWRLFEMGAKETFTRFNLFDSPYRRTALRTEYFNSTVSESLTFVFVIKIMRRRSDSHCGAVVSVGADNLCSTATQKYMQCDCPLSRVY